MAFNMSGDYGRRGYDAEIAVLKERVTQLEKRCDKKDLKMEEFAAFQNRTIAYAIAGSALVTYFLQYLLGK